MSHNGFMSKVCNTCEREKPFEDYYKSKTGKFGYHGQCKDCMKAAREHDSDRIKQRASDWNKNNKKSRKEIQSRYALSDNGRSVKRRTEQKRRTLKNDLDYSLPITSFQFLGDFCLLRRISIYKYFADRVILKKEIDFQLILDQLM